MSNNKKIVSFLKKKRFKLAIAESCTGGKLSSDITSVSGSSKVFTMGLITYSNQAKIDILKVPRKIIKKYGAVSKECCEAMVHDLSKNSKSKINVSITGIAGPGGGSKLNPVGLVYIGIKMGKYLLILENQFGTKNRSYIQKITVREVLKKITKIIS